MLKFYPPGRRPAVVPHLLALLGYGLLSVGLTWPAARVMRTHLVEGDGGRFAYSGLNDAIQYSWNFWWSARALGGGQNPFETNLLFYPQGASLYLHTLLSTNSLPFAPITAAFGPLAAYNLSAMFGLALTGYAVFLLAGHFAGRGSAAWFAGALVAASPFLAMKLQVSHLNLLHLGWLALFVLCLIRLGESGAWRYALLAALCFVLNALTDWYLAIIAAFAMAVWGGLSLWRRPRPLALVSRYALIVLLATSMLAPILAGAWATRGAAEPVTQARRDSWQIGVLGYSSDAVGLLFPSLLQPIWRDQAEALTAPLVASVPVIEGWYIAAGWVLLGLAALGARRHGRAQWRLLALAGLGWLFSLGPELRLLGVSTGLPMPYALLQRLPLIETGRRPNLFAIICILIFAIFAAQGLGWLLTRAGPRRRAGLMLGLGLLAAIELWPAPRHPVDISADPIYTTLAAQPGPVVDLPVGADIEARTLRNQMAHGQPILRGYISRPPAYPTLSYSPLVRALALVEPLPALDIIALGEPDLLKMQCFYRFRHVVAERDLVQPSQIADLRSALARLGVAEPWLDDGRYLAYQLPAPDPPCAPFAYLGAGWNGLEGASGQAWRWMGARADLWVVNPSATTTSVVIELSAEAFDPDGTQAPNLLQVRYAGQTLAAFPVTRAARTYQIALTLPPGPSQIALVAEREARDAQNRPLSLSVTKIRIHF